MVDLSSMGAGEQSPAPFASDPFTREDEPVWRITLWPHRSLSRDGFRHLMLFSAAAMAFPVLAFAGTPVIWALLPYVALALFALWALFKLNYRSARISEELRLWPDAIAVERRDPTGRVRRWAANPYWVKIDLEDTREISRYLTLRGSGRRIELGAFLTPEERVELASELNARIAGMNRVAT